MMGGGGVNHPDGTTNITSLHRTLKKLYMVAMLPYLEVRKKLGLWFYMDFTSDAVVRFCMYVLWTHFFDFVYNLSSD